ncbi:MAG: hypothetical protein H6737_23135 [Alphaproteobacteria bacterium]|nr:hypothetical protein [Alphaproteobacteria bacterium]
MIVLFLAQLTAHATPVTSCKNLLALKLMVDNDLTDCHDDLLSTASGSTYAVCNNQTANWCVDNLPAQTLTTGFDFEAKSLPGAKCVDGSPAYYFQSTDHTSHTDFIVRLNGHSGRCKGQWDPAADQPKSSAGQSCVGQILKEKVFTGMPLPAVEESHVKGIIGSSGPFQDEMRVWIPSCSNDNYQGNLDIQDQSVWLGHCDDTGNAWCETDADCSGSCINPVEVNLEHMYSQGHQNVKAVLTELLTDDTYPDPKVTLVGTSGGSGGLTMILDDLADHIRTIDPAATVIGVLDSNQEASVHAFDAYLDGAEDDDCTVYNNPECAGAGQPPIGTANRANFEITVEYPNDTGDTGLDPYLAWDRRAYWEPNPGEGAVTYPWNVMGAALDTTCIAHHAPNKVPCRNHEHVRNHHLSTPILVVQSQRDKGLFGAGGNPNPVEFAVQPDVTWDMLEHSNASAVARVQRFALYDFYAMRGSAHGEALGVRRGVFAPMEPDHELTRANLPLHQLENTTQGCKTLEQVLTQWIDNTGEPVFVEGMPEGANATFDCAP